jgi:predicted acetyltransferase
LKSLDKWQSKFGSFKLCVALVEHNEVERKYNLRGLKIMGIELVKPSVEMEPMILDFASEFMENKEDTINGCCGLTRSNNYHEWLQYIEKVENGLISDRIPSSTFVAIDNSSKLIIGIIDIRHYLNEEHFYSGHIGYSVRPRMRSRSYGTKILKLGLKKAKELNLEKVLLTCKKSNFASQRVIEKNNGVLEKEILDDGETYLVYWILL